MIYFRCSRILFLLIVLISIGFPRKYRVLVLFSSQAEASIAPASIRTHIKNYVIDVVNDVYDSSATSGQVMPYVELAAIRKVGFSGSSYPEADVAKMMADTGIYDGIDSLRILYSADIVAFMDDGWFVLTGYSAVIHSVKENAYVAISAAAVIPPYYVAAHEFGHVFGCAHGGGAPGTSHYPYGYGYTYTPVPPGAAWGDIMVNTSGDVHQPWFSNPGLNFSGVPRGRADSADCTRVHELRADTVAAFMSAPASATVKNDTISGEEYIDVSAGVLSTQGSLIFQAGAEGKFTANQISINPGFRFESAKIVMNIKSGVLAKTHSSNGPVEDNKLSPAASGSKIHLGMVGRSLHISYRLSEASVFSASIVGAKGEVLRTLRHNRRPAGNYTDILDINESVNGVYFLLLKVGATIESRKLVLAR